MPILGAYLMPHPPLLIPEIGRGSESKIINTVAAMEEAAAEIARLKPDTIIFITPHANVYSDYFQLSQGEAATGDLARFGAAEMQFSAYYDSKLVNEISCIADADGIPAGTDGQQDAGLDHGVIVPMYYINAQHNQYNTVRVSQSGLGAEMHYKLGKIISVAVNNLGRNAVVIASGDLSHKLSDSGPYEFAPEGKEFDTAIMKNLCEWDVQSLLTMDNNLREKAGECGYGSIIMMVGCLDGMNVSAAQLSYEGTFGVGYGVVSIIPTAAYDSYEVDSYCKLARQSLEYFVRTGKDFSASPESSPENLPTEMLTKKAGVFVSLHMDGQLRGCIGTIAPVTTCVAAEIIQNAVSAGTRDPRFHPVQAHELPKLVYKVDVLDAPENIDSPTKLDVFQYGVIVESEHKRGLLLPNLDGVDTVDMQISIAMQKAGISDAEPITLKRFKVTRYEQQAASQ